MQAEISGKGTGWKLALGLPPGAGKVLPTSAAIEDDNAVQIE
jgi:hypothetical protein